MATCFVSHALFEAEGASVNHSWGRRIMPNMILKLRFWNWVLSFGALGLIIPFALMAWCFLFHQSVGVETFLWPSSIMFMALDTPSPSIWTVVSVYAVAWLENAMLYAVLGALLWPLAHLALRLRYSRNSPSKSS